jgi:hypothetical protein
MPDYSLVKLKNRFTLTLSDFTLTNGKLSAYTMVVGNDMFNALGAQSAPYTQPTGFDEWMAMYDQYIVHQSAVKVIPLAYRTSGEDEVTQHLPFRLVIVPFRSTVFNIATIDPTEVAYSRSKVYNGNSIPVVDNDGTVVSNADAGNTSIRGVFNRMSTKKILGYKDLADVEEVRGVASTTAPSRKWSWLVYVETLIPTTTDPDDYSMLLEAQIYYKAQFISRKQDMVDST